MANQSTTLAAEAQQVLDELWAGQLLPFALSVGKFTQDNEEYTLHFHDSRIRHAYVPIKPGEEFREAVRIAVLARVAKISGPLVKPPKKGLSLPPLA